MINLEKETAELLAFLEKQPRLSDSAKQEGRKLGDRQAERIYNGGTVKDAGNEKAPVQASAEVASLLSRISPDCPYNDWFRIGCALKHEGYAYEVFRDWSAKAPKRFDEDACRKTWDSIEDDHDNMVSLGTLHWMAEKSILPEPTTTEEMAKQAYDFISTLFRPGEHFELVVKRGCKDGKFFPSRSKENVCQFNPEGKSAFLSSLKAYLVENSPGLGKAPSGAWVSLNPICEAEKLTGNAPSDKDVIDFRYALVEADDLNQEEQWRKLSGLNLPIKCVTWSGGKSLHAIVKVDAGTDCKLYRDRVAKLYGYLEKHHFPADAANKNPSRLTRIPGFYRDCGKQYLFAHESGPQSWEEFEAKNLMITTAQSIPETRTDELSDLINRKGTPLYPDKNGIPSIVNQSFFAAYTIHSLGLKRDHGSDWRHYNPNTGLWNKVPSAELLRLISSQLLDFSRKNNVPSLAAKRSASLCREILSFMDGESSEDFLLPMRQRNVIHVGNGMVEIAPDGSTTFKPFAREYYSCTRTPYRYDPEAKCPKFLTQLLAPCMSQDDIDCLQLYVGQCLLGVNLAQMFMMLTGTPGAGKSTLVNVIEKLISRENCTELRLEQMAERFEMNRLRGKTLLTGKDVKSYFLTSRGAYKLKALIGGDVLTTEAKGSNETFDIPGEFNVIITANSNLTVDIDSDN